MVFEGPVSAFSQHEYTEMRTAITEALQTGYLGVIQGMGLQVRTVQHGICNVVYATCIMYRACIIQYAAHIGVLQGLNLHFASCVVYSACACTSNALVLCCNIRVRLWLLW